MTKRLRLFGTPCDLYVRPSSLEPQPWLQNGADSVAPILCRGTLSTVLLPPGLTLRTAFQVKYNAFEVWVMSRFSKSQLRRRDVCFFQVGHFFWVPPSSVDLGQPFAFLLTCRSESSICPLRRSRPSSSPVALMQLQLLKLAENQT